MRHCIPRLFAYYVFLASPLAVLGWGFPLPVASAETTGTEDSAGSRRAGVAPREEHGVRVMTPAREAAALTFARRHHPELADLLERLQRGNRRQYDRALLELFRTSERLARVEERDPQRYEIALELWKLDSRIQLRAARMAMSADPELEAELKTLLLERNAWKVRLLMLDRERTQTRLERLEKSISAALKNPETAAEKDLQRLKRMAGAAAADARGNRKQGSAGKNRKSMRKAADQSGSPSRKTNKPD